MAPLGRGGMGVVYMARSPQKELVAVKLMAAEHSADNLHRARFLREATTLARLAHPSVVRILSHGALPDGRLFLIMEFLPGQSLRQVLE